MPKVEVVTHSKDVFEVPRGPEELNDTYEKLKSHLLSGESGAIVFGDVVEEGQETVIPFSAISYIQKWEE